MIVPDNKGWPLKTTPGWLLKPYMHEGTNI